MRQTSAEKSRSSSRTVWSVLMEYFCLIPLPFVSFLLAASVPIFQCRFKPLTPHDSQRSVLESWGNCRTSPQGQVGLLRQDSQDKDLNL